MINILKNGFNYVKSSVKKAGGKALAVLGGLGLAAAGTPAKAAVTFDGTTGTFSGIFDLAPYYSAVGIIIGAIAVIAAIGLAIRQFRKVS